MQSIVLQNKINKNLEDKKQKSVKLSNMQSTIIRVFTYQASGSNAFKFSQWTFYKQFNGLKQNNINN
ncbi:unnamed protein product [Paramecium sonneborni]|uniref:Uncharacterized protein n=1 Tax=Paramecium sonneborni TaxID=65129 RepID=A0A8S1QYY5_9CILI|nr:unnamed protein product [Paramecium sonneborni]